MTQVAAMANDLARLLVQVRYIHQRGALNITLLYDYNMTAWIWVKMTSILIDSVK